MADLASTLIAQQDRDGAWPGSCRGGTAVKCTTWSLLAMSLGATAPSAPTVAQPELWPVEYRWGDPEPGYSVEDWPIFESWTNVRVENRGLGDAFGVTATVIRGLANTTVPDARVVVGDVAAGRSAWSKDTFTTRVDMDHKVDPCKGGLVWRIEYDDAAGVHRVRDSVPQFPPGECPCEIQLGLAEHSASSTPPLPADTG